MSKAIAEPTGDKKCPECGKGFFVQWPHLWRYARREGPRIKYFCSYTCVRAYDNKKGEKKVAKRIITKEQEQEAVRIALDGGDPLSFLQKHGINNPAQKWYDIKEAVKDSDPDTYAKLPNRIQRKAKQPTLADAMTGMQTAADQFFGECNDMGLKIETPEKPKRPEKAQPDYEITALRHKNFGEFYFDHDHNRVDWRTPEGDEMSLSVEGWRKFFQIVPDLMKRLGVSL